MELIPDNQSINSAEALWQSEDPASFSLISIVDEKGMKDMKVDLDNKLVTLTFDSRKNNEQKIIEAFSKLGYDAVGMKNKKSWKILKKY